MSNPLDEIEARADKASNELGRLAEGNPGTNWRWSIPAQPDRDTDLILSASQMDVKPLLAALRAVEAVHIPAGYTESVIDWDCIEGECDHDGDCPEKTITPCRQCTLPSHDGTEILIPWPCPTITAIREALS